MLLKIEEGRHQAIIEFIRLEEYIRILTTEYDIKVWPSTPSQEAIPTSQFVNTPNEVATGVSPVQALYNNLLSQMNRTYLSVKGLRKSSDVEKIEVKAK